MSKTDPRFSPFAYFYAWLFFALLGLLPIWAAFATGLGAHLTSPYRIASLAWPVFIAVSFWYASQRCSSERLRYRDGLLWIAASMIAGTMYMSFLLLLPVLLVVFSSSVLISAYGDIRRKPAYAPENGCRSSASSIAIAWCNDKVL